MTQRAIDGNYIYFVTTLVKNRAWFFVRPDRANELGQVIKNACSIKNFDPYAYCILPNHVHLLVRKRPLNQAQRALEKARCEGEVRLASSQQRRLPNSPSQRGLSSPRVKRYTLSQLMQSIKGTYSWQTTDEQLWHPRFNFRIIDTEEHFYNTVNYIIHNYKKMNLLDLYGKAPFVFVDWQRIKNLL